MACCNYTAVSLYLNFTYKDGSNYKLKKAGIYSKEIMVEGPQYIYVIRHGQTDYNKNGYVQGEGIDAALNELGIQQANAFYDHYGDVPFDRVYTSKLRRARQTVQKFIDRGIPWESYKGLNEINWGKREGIKTDPQESEYYQNMVRRWREGEVSVQIEGGESPQNVFDRQKEVVDLLRKRKQDKNVLICMHGRAIRILLCQLTDTDLCLMDDFVHANLGLYLLKLDDGKFSIEKHCDTAHLEDL